MRILDRFDCEASRTLERAREEALQLNHGCVGSEHVLLGLLGDPHVVELLMRMGITATDVRASVCGRVARGARPVFDDVLPYSAHAREVFYCTLEESDGFGHTSARNPHLLLGLVKEPEGLGGRVLEEFGGNLDGMRHEVLEFLVELDEQVGACPGSGHGIG